MTFNSAAWAVDGARIESSLPRRAVWSSTGGAEGISNKGDLKVSALSTAAAGLQVSGGGALLLNRYQGTDPNETYTVSNRGAHILTTAQMAGAATSAPVVRHFLVCVTVGDPTGNQAGHPWMPASSEGITDPETFEYVRPWLIPCSAGTETFAELGLSYPALALSRLRIPAGATTYTDADLTDLRVMAIVRTKTESDHITASGTNALNGLDGVAGTFERWPNENVLTTKIPTWATKAKITGFVEGARLSKAGGAKLRAMVTGEGISTPVTNVDESNPRNANDRVTYNIGGVINIPARLRGTAASFAVEGRPNNGDSKGMLFTTPGSTSMMLQVTFEEGAE